MCGICGIYNYRSGEPVAAAALGLMNRLQRHRGPDGQGDYRDGALGLGHCRLKIIDLSDAARQPMTSEDGTLWLTYNGEIFNYLELRAELKERGHLFVTATDSEVILHAYEEWGEACLDRFNGQWAFALWNSRTRELFAARDRFGIKPLHYVLTPGGIVFASEIRPLLAFLPEVRADEERLATFMTDGLLGADDNTLFLGVKRLPPGHCLRVTPAGISERCYWQLSPAEPRTGDTGVIADEFRALLLDAVRLRLRSDVAVGTCLSGGIDSSGIVALAAAAAAAEQSTRYAYTTFTMQFAGDRDTTNLRAMLRRYPVSANFARPAYDDFLAVLADTVDTQEEPFPMTSIITQYLLMRLVKQTPVVVLLDGQGADETLAGYDNYQLYYWRQLARAGGHGRLAYEMLARSWQSMRWGDAAFMRLALNRALRPTGRNVTSAAAGSAAGLHAALRRSVAEDLQHLLRYQDRNSMHFALETRVPFLDHRLAEYAQTLPEAMLVRNGLGKYILRRALAGMVPDEVLWRGRKIGLYSPEREWLRCYARANRESGAARYLREALPPESRARVTPWRLLNTALWHERMVKHPELPAWRRELAGARA